MTLIDAAKEAERVLYTRAGLTHVAMNLTNAIAAEEARAKPEPWMWAVVDPDSGIDLYHDAAKARDRAGNGCVVFPVYRAPVKEAP